MLKNNGRKALVCSLVLFGATISVPTEPTSAPTSAPAKAAEASGEVAVATEKKIFEDPVLVTDVGQGNNARLVQVMLKRDGSVEFKSEAQAGVEMLEGRKTLIIGVGASTKGLGAAGLDADTELTRGKALIKAAKDQEIDIIGVHIGGPARRGELSDQFVEAVFRASDTFIAWEGGNKDGFLTKLAEETNIPYIQTKGKKEVGEKLVALFKEPESDN